MPRRDGNLVTCEAEDPHAGGVLACGDLIVPPRMPKRNDAGGIGDPNAVVVDGQSGTLVSAKGHIDACCPGTAGILQQLVENVGKRIVEQATNAVDRVGADACANGGRVHWRSLRDMSLEVSQIPSPSSFLARSRERWRSAR